jgi:DNA gyrase subunit B
MYSIEAIRKRPGMFVGDIWDGSGLLHMLWEVVANALDQHLAGYCTRIAIEISKDGAISVLDDGRGIRLDPIDGLPFAEIALTSSHSGPTFDGHAPHEHIATRGLGLFAVCALSAWLEVEVCRDGDRYRQRFERGVAVSPLRRCGQVEASGTRITFSPDPEIFHAVWLNPGLVAERLREISFLFPRLTLDFHDQREHRFHEPRGLAAYLESTMNLRAYDSRIATFTHASAAESIVVEVAAVWHAHRPTSLRSFANVMPTTGGGTHVEGLLRGLATGARKALPDACRGRRAKEIERALIDGLNGVICVRLDDPEYGRPTKDLLSSPHVSGVVERCIADPFAECLAAEPALVGRIASALKR